MGGAQALWGRETMGGLAHGGIAQGNRVDAEAGYGLASGAVWWGRRGLASARPSTDGIAGSGMVRACSPAST